MTDSPHNPTGRGSEADNASAQPVDHNKFADVLQLIHHPSLGVHAPEAPAAAAPGAKPEEHKLKPADDRSATTAYADGIKHSLAGMVTGTGAMLGTHVKTDAQIQEDIKHNAAADAGPNALVGLWKTGTNLVTHLPEIATGSYHALGQAVETARHGTANQKAELAGGATAFIGTMLVGGAGNVGKLSTEGRVLEGAETAYAEAQGARTAMGEYGQTAKVATNAAVKTVEDKAAVTAAERAALVKPVVHPVEAVIPPTPASTTARIGSELTAPKVGEIATTSPSLFSRFRSSVTSPFKSLLGTPEGAVGETKNLATRVDGLKAGEGSLSRPTISPVVHPAERLPVGLRTPETRIGETRIGETKLAESRLPQSHVPEVTQPPAVRPTSLQHPIKVEPPVAVEPVPRARAEAPHSPTPGAAADEVAGRAAHGGPEAATEAAPKTAPKTTVPSAAEPPIHAEGPASVEHPRAVDHPLSNEPRPANGRVEIKEPVVSERVESPRVESPRVESPREKAPLTDVPPASFEKPVGNLETPVQNLEAPRLTTVESPKIIAGQASQNFENLSRLTDEGRVNLAPAVQQGFERSLQKVGEQLKVIARDGEASLTPAARTELADNMATVEKAVGSTIKSSIESTSAAAGADAAVGRELAELKTSVEKLTAPVAPNPLESGAGTIGHSTEATTAAVADRTAPALSSVTPTATVVSSPAVAATKASANIENLGRLAADSGMPLSEGAEQSLQNLGRQLKTFSESGDAALSLTARKELASDLATVEKSIASSGADQNVVRELNQLKASLNEMAPATTPIVPITEAPAVIATETSANIAALNKVAGEAGLTLAPEADQALRNISSQLKVVAESGAETIPATTSRELGENLAQVERSLMASAADPTVMRQFNELKTSLNDLGKASAERTQLGNLDQSLTALEGHGAELSTNVQEFGRQIDQIPGLSSVDQKIASTISTKLETIEQKIAERSLEQAPVTTAADIQQVVRELDQPQYTRFLAEHPQAARAFEDVQASARNLAASSSQVEASQLTLNGFKQARLFEADVDGLATLSKDLKATLPAGEAAQPAARALESIENNLTTIKAGANPEAVLRKVNADIDVIEASGVSGADKIAADLRQNVGQLENTTTVLDRTRRLEESISTISKESSSLEGQTAKLSQQFADDARTSASTSAMVPTNAQVSDQLQLISRQAKLVDASETGVNALTRIKNAYTRVEELTAGETLGAEQSAALRQVKQSIAELDQASIDATGLRRFESSTPRIAEQSTKVETLSERISQSVDMTTPAAREAQVEQRLADISKAAQEVKTAGTLDEQVRAVNKLATSVQDPELQAALSRSGSGLRSFDELKGTTAELHESVSYRALERSKIAAEAEAENSARAAKALQERIQADAATAQAPALQGAVSDYRAAAEAFAKAPDKNLAAIQLDQKFAAVETQLKAVAPTSSILQGEEMVALRRSQAGLSQSAADSELLSRSLIDRRLPVVENGFNQIGSVGNSVAQREIMRGISDQIQGMRYLEARVGEGADKLTQAQMQLTRAQNELEAATYRGNLVKLAAAGNQSATDKLLISGLTSDGYKATSITNTSGPAARLIEDFAKNRIGLLGRDQGSFSVRSLAASDPLFVNNPGWLSASAIRNTGYTLMGVGGITFGVGRVREAFGTDAAKVSPTSDQSLPLNANVTGAVTGTGTAAATGTNADNRSVGRAPIEANGFTPNGQALARNAFTQDMTMQALPRMSSVNGDGTLPFVSPNAASTTSISPDSASFAAATQYAVASNYVATQAARSVVPESGSFMLDRNDPDLAVKLFNISISGTLFGVKKGSEAISSSEIRTPLTVAQSLQLRSNIVKTTEGGRLDKLATSMFAVPSAQLSSPLALGYGRRDVQSARVGGAGFAGYAAGVGRFDSTALSAANMMSADADAGTGEGGVNAGTKHLKHVESGAEARIDSSAVHSGGSSTAQNNVDDEDEHEHGTNDPAVPAVSVVSAVPAAASPVMSRRVPNADKPEVDGAASAVVAQSNLPDGDPKAADARVVDAKKGAPVGAPPRKRANQDAISA